MLPTSDTKIGQIRPAEPHEQPKKKREPRNLDDGFWKEHRENAAATLAAEPQLPPVLTLTLRMLGAVKYDHEMEYVRLSNASICDEHLPPLIELLHRSECAVQRLDLAFNHLTDAGLRLLGDALCRKLVEVDFSFCAFELTHLHIGGNALTADGVEELRRRLREAGREVEVDDGAILRDPCVLCTVGQILEPADKSPAGVAGLRAGDEVVALGPLRTLREPKKGFTTSQQRQLDAYTYYLDVGRSVAPLVQASKGRPVDVVVRRTAAAEPETAPTPPAAAPPAAAPPAAAPPAAAPSSDAPAAAPPVATDSAGGRYVRVSLIPGEWEGQGLLGCRLKAVPEP